MDPTTIAVIARFTVKSEAHTLFLNCCVPLIERTQQENGCLFYQLFAANPPSNEFIMMECWQSEQALHAHLEAPHTQAFFKASAEYLVSEIHLEKYHRPPS
jgi:quinol monooxygenase YgiN